MSKRSPKKTSTRVKAPAKGYARLVTAIESANLQMTGRAASLVNQTLVIRNWLIGAYLVEYEQDGADRAKYGAKLLERLAKDLEKRGLKGLGRSILERCRTFFLTYPQFATAIPETVSTELVSLLPGRDSVTSGYEISIPVRPSKDSVTSGCGIRQPVVGELEPSSPQTRNSAEALPTPLSTETLLRFSWTHLLEFIRIDDPWKRAFYENECLKGKWSKRQLQRQIESLLYERTGLSNNKKALVERARQADVKETVADMIRDPYVLEFIYLNWFKTHMLAEGDNPPVGIILCSDKDGTEVEFATAGMDSQMFVSRYLVALPSAEQLRKFVEADRARIESS